MRAILACFLLAAPFAGCIEPSPAATEPDLADLLEAPTRVNATSGASEFVAPTWTAGRWWDVQVQLDFGFGVLQDLRGTLVVSTVNESGYRVGSTDVDMGTFDRYFDSFYVGDFDAALNAVVGQTPVVLYDWPLAPDKTWTTSLRLMNIDQFALRVYNATIRTSTFEDEPATERLRFQGETDRGDIIDYDYSAQTGWMTYFRLTNKTTGRVALSIDYLQSGNNFTGPVHHVSRATLYERIVFFPPIDERMRPYPAYAGLPPAERIAVKPGWDWIDELGFLFTFPILVGAGTASYAIVRPDLRVDNDTHHGAGDQFQYKVKRTTIRGQTAGDWTIALQAAGTAGAYVALYGFRDEVVQL